MSSESFPLTFGLEIEHVFAFHQSLLQAHLKNAGDASKIQKDIDQDTRQKLRVAPQRYLASRKQYNGWGLTGPTSYLSGEAEAGLQDQFEEQLEQYGCRGYGNEPLYVARNAMFGASTSAKGVGVEVSVHDSFKRKPTDFEKWQLVNDTSLLGLPHADLAAALEDSEPQFISGSADKWDSHGIELVSRVLPFVENSFTEISDYLDVLKGNQSLRHRAFLSEHCGLHVHIGHPTSGEQGEQRTGLPLSTLQHLAYILVIYEGAISTLFPTSRREDSHVSRMDIASNRDKFFKEPVAEYVPTSEDDPPLTYEELQSVDYQVPEEQLSPPFCFREARDLIFATGQSYESLANLMCPEGVGRNALVNFMYTARSLGEGAQTVEFRQHEGSLDAKGIRWWVKFCAELILFAQRMARQRGAAQEYDGTGYRWTEWNEKIDIEDLMAEMGFEEEGKMWARERKTKFSQET